MTQPEYYILLAIAAILIVVLLAMIIVLWRRNRRTVGKVAFLFNAIDNGDYAFRYSKTGKATQWSTGRSIASRRSCNTHAMNR